VFEARLYNLVGMNDFPRFDLQGKTALVTGAARGLGRAISLALAHAGADVALGLRDVGTGGELVPEIENMGRRCLPLQMDVSRMEQIASAIDGATSQFGKLDILVNNAGIAPENLAENVVEKDFDATLAVNLKGTFFATQAAGRIMIRQKYGRIINMSSQAGFVALPTESIYCMTKAAIAHLTKCLAVEWGKHNITVNGIAPTFIHTPGTEEYLSNPENRADTIERIAALHRIGEPMDVAGAVVFLASDAASLITGHTILIDGGWTAR
jgi:NAD(P)-dependent dehydrogenase (short-subunit alcohol dehydrogenase family)